MLSRFVIAFLPRSKCLLISWLQSPSAAILEPKKIVCHVSIVSPSICHEVMGPDAMIFIFSMLSLKPAFSLSSFTFTKKLFSSSLLSALEILAFSWHPLPTTHIPLVKGVRWSRLSSVGLGNKLPTLLLSKSHGRGNEELRIHQPTLEVIL